jgi:hypothetical protein
MEEYQADLGEGDGLPPRSPDLTPVDFYFWAVVKDKVYTENPKTIYNLKSANEEALTYTI